MRSNIKSETEVTAQGKLAFTGAGNPRKDFQYKMFDQKMLDKYFHGGNGLRVADIKLKGPFC